MRHNTGLLLLVLSCASDVRGPEPPEPSAGTSSLPAATITARVPQREFPVPALVNAPVALALEIARIHNPSSQSFSVAAAVTWSAAGAASVEEPLGVVTPYPADRPGAFLLSVSAQAGELLTRKTGRLALRLSLLPTVADRPLVTPLEVSFGESSWR